MRRDTFHRGGRVLPKVMLLAAAILVLAGCTGRLGAAKLPTTPAMRVVPSATAVLHADEAERPVATAVVRRSQTPTLEPSALPTASATAPAARTATAMRTPTASPTPTPPHPLSIESMRQGTYPGSNITMEQKLSPGANYDRAIVSYLSEGLKIYALLTVPRGEKPSGGWPVILFNHGFIPPSQYRTTERYVDYVDAIARRGYIVLRSDYRGHGNSEGEAAGGYASPAYTIDVLNAVAAIKRFPDANPQQIGMWGHSMGGGIVLRAMVTTADVKAGVIWAGTVASYADLLEQRRGQTNDGAGPLPTLDPGSPRWRWLPEMLATYGPPEENPAFYAAISPNSYLNDLSGAIQIHHGTADSSVPVQHSATLEAQVRAVGKPVELYIYEGDNHNISANFARAMSRSIQFFDLHVKGAGSN